MMMGFKGISSGAQKVFLGFTRQRSSYILTIGLTQSNSTIKTITSLAKNSNMAQVTNIHLWGVHKFQLCVKIPTYK